MEYFYQLFSNIGIFIILAVSLNLINGHTGMFSLGHAGFWAVGAYTSSAFTKFAGPYILAFLRNFHINHPCWLTDLISRPQVVGQFLFAISIVIGMLSAALCGIFVGVPCLRLRGDYLAIATLGFSEIIRIIIVNLDVVGGARGFTGIPHYSNIFWIYGMVIITVIVSVNLVRSAHGRAFIAIREDEIAAECIGINTTKYKVICFLIGGGFAGSAGALFAHHTMFLHPNGFTFMQGIVILIMIVLGGLGSITGAIISATFLTILPEILRFFGPFISQLRMVLYALALILIMLLRPEGLMGKKEITDFISFKKIRH